MRVVPPIAIDSVTSSTIPEEVAATYSTGTTYAQGALVGLASTLGLPQTVWRSKQNGNLNNPLVEGLWWTFAGIVYPVYSSGHNYQIGQIATVLSTHSLHECIVSHTNSPVTDLTNWKNIGKTNRYKMFDYTRNDRSTALGSINVVFAPGKRIDAICMTGIKANSYSISVSSVSAGGVVYTSSGSLNNRIVRTWYEHLTVPFTTQKSIFLLNIPPVYDAVITLVLTATSGNAEIEAIGAGRAIYFGATQYGTSSETLNFSTISRDEQANAVLTKRRNVPKSRQTVFAHKKDVDLIIDTRDLLNAEPAFWYGIDDASEDYFEAASILGIYKDFKIDISTFNIAVITFELEKL